MNDRKRKSLDEVSDESEHFEEQWEQLVAGDGGESERERLLATIASWVQDCAWQGRFIPLGSADRRAFRSLIEHWSSRLRHNGLRLEQLYSLAEFDPSAGVPLTVECPYPGLDPYTQSRRGSFFGREGLIASCIAHLEQAGNRILLIIGASGSGKSSLALAGILPSLEELHQGEWLFGPRLTPGAYPLAALAESVAQVIRRPEQVTEIQHCLAAEPDRALGRLGELCQERPLMLLIDQFEELLTLCRDAVEQRAFAQVLCALSDPSTTAGGFTCKVLLTLRTDHLARFESNDALQPLHRRFVGADNDRYISGIGFSDIRRAIKEPADQAGLRFVPPDLIDRLASQTAGLASGLPLLQFALRRLWDTRPKNELGEPLDLITEEMVHDLPDVERTLGTVAAGIFRTFTASQKRVCERLLQELVVLDESFEEPLRRRRNEAELTEVLRTRFPAEQDIARVIEDFVAAGLVRRFGEGPDRQLEVAHEALLRHWEFIYAILTGAEVKERLHLVKQIGRDAAQWVGKGGIRLTRDSWNTNAITQKRPKCPPMEGRGFRGLKSLWHMVSRLKWIPGKGQAADYLNLKGELLHKALDYAQEGWLDDVSRTYVQECKREDKKNRWVLRNLIGMIVLLVVGVLVLTIYQMREAQKETRLYRSLKFAIEAQTKLDRNPNNSALLALHAAYQTYSEGETIPPETKDALREVSQVFEGVDAYTLQGQLDQVTNVAFSLDGNHLATSSTNGWVRLWQAPFDHTEPPLYFHPNPVATSPALLTSVAFSPDGTRLVAASLDGTVKVWNADTGQELRQFTVPITAVTHVVLSPDGTRLSAASLDGTVKVWNVDTGQELRQFTGPTTAVTRIALSPDGTRLVAASLDGTARVWNADTSQELRTLTGHTGAITSVSFSSDGTRLVAASLDGTARVWNADTGQELRQFTGHTDAITTVSFSPDRTRLVTGSADRTVKVWNADTGQELRTLTGHPDAITSVSFSPNGTWLVTASADRTVKVWNADTGQELRPLAGHTARVTSVAFSPDRTRLVTGSEDRTVKVWKVDTGQELRTLTGHPDAITSVSFSPNGTWLVTASTDRTVKVWNADTGQELRPLAGHTAPVTSVAFSPDETRLVTASLDATARMWKVDTGQELRPLAGSATAVTSMSFSPDGTRLSAASVDGTARVWNADTGQELCTLTGHTEAITSVSFSPDGTRLVTASADRTVKVWNADTGQELRTLTGHTGAITSVSFSPDGTRLVTASADRTVKVWNADTGQELRTLTGHTALIKSVTFDPDKPSYLVTASADGIVKVWNLQTGKERFSITAPKERLLGVAFSPDSGTLVTVREDGLVWRNDLLYDLYDEGSKDSEKLIRKVEETVMQLCNIQDRTNLKAEVESEASRTHCLTKFRQ